MACARVDRGALMSDETTGADDLGALVEPANPAAPRISLAGWESSSVPTNTARPRAAWSALCATPHGHEIRDLNVKTHLRGDFADATY